MNLYILRHGIAVDATKGGCKRDSDRYLTPEGKRKVRQIARALRTLDVRFEVILSSPYVRARQTAELVREVFAGKPSLRLSDDLSPGGSMPALINSIRKLGPFPEDLLLVGHEPYLSTLISLLVSGERGLRIELKKAGLCRLTVEALRASRCAALEWLLVPRQMLRMR